MKPTVEPNELAAMNWCARIVKRPIVPGSPGELARLYAAYFKRLHQTIKAQAVVSEEQL